MKRTERPRRTCRALAAMAALALLLGLWAPAARGEVTRLTLTLALYPSVPDYDFFVETVRACWAEEHPEVALAFVDWDCYGDGVPEDLDVFVFDAVQLDVFAAAGSLLTLSEADVTAYGDLIPAFTEGCRVDGRLCAVPQLLCTDLLYTRKGDDALRDVGSIAGLRTVLADGELLTDRLSRGSRVCLCLQAMVDDAQRYMDTYPPLDREHLTPGVTGALAAMADMCRTEPGEDPGSGDPYDAARRFARGSGRAYIGYSEAMSAMAEDTAGMDFRLFSMTGDESIPVFYVDLAAVNAGISEEKKAAALDLLNLITGKDLMVRVSAAGGRPQYLFAARYSVYDALAADDPIYAGLREIASVPDARVFRIRPNGYAYIVEAKEHVETLAPFDR